MLRDLQCGRLKYPGTGMPWMWGLKGTLLVKLAPNNYHNANTVNISLYRLGPTYYGYDNPSSKINVLLFVELNKELSGFVMASPWSNRSKLIKSIPSSQINRQHVCNCNLLVYCYLLGLFY